MPTASDMLQIISSFEGLSGTPSVLPFGGRVQGPNGDTSHVQYLQRTISGTTKGSIVLPNGSRYDPHQTYDAPVTMQQLEFQVICKPGLSTINGVEGTESGITAYYNDFCIQTLGKRGTLFGAAYNISSDTQATARLLRVKMDWNMPRQIMPAIGGDGANRPGIKTAIITFTFDMLTEWNFTY